MMRRAVIAVNGVIDDYTAVARLLRPGDHLIGADGGALHLLTLGRTPHVVVGDLDSLPAAVVDELAAQGVQFERHHREKDQTDLELAIERALADGAEEVLLIGALGGRLDQTLANLLIVAQRAWPAPVRIVEGEQVAEVLRGPGVLELHGAPGDTVSLIPLGAAVEGITYTGLRYPLADATLAFGSTRGVSNELLDSVATVTIRAGVALVVHTVRADLP
ncbi:MAG TPA: thiamine diphosphokinase [Chloroflexi bacterium]|nr:thiamine diphosphokinase [Chloroflexota bacterium]